MNRQQINKNVSWIGVQTRFFILGMFVYFSAFFSAFFSNTGFCQSSTQNPTYVPKVVSQEKEQDLPYSIQAHLTYPQYISGNPPSEANFLCCTERPNFLFFGTYSLFDHLGVGTEIMIEDQGGLLDPAAGLTTDFDLNRILSLSGYLFLTIPASAQSTQSSRTTTLLAEINPILKEKKWSLSLEFIYGLSFYSGSSSDLIETYRTEAAIELSRKIYRKFEVNLSLSHIQYFYNDDTSIIWNQISVPLIYKMKPFAVSIGPLFSFAESAKQSDNGFYLQADLSYELN
jgi:hypothetical protein